MKLEIRAILVFFLLECSVLAAPVRQYRERLWQTDDGLPHNSVLALAQTSDGYIWVGTQQGLARFDGLRFVALDGSAELDFEFESIASLCAARNGALWIGTADRGLFQFKDGQLQRFEKQSALGSDSIKTLLETRDGALWIGATNGLLQWNAKRLTRWTTADGLAENLIRSIYEDRHGTLWVAAGNPALNRLHDGAFVSHPIPKTVYGALRTVSMDQQDNLWVGANSGLTRVKENGTLHFTKVEGLSDNLVSIIHEDREGQLWVGTYGGLSRIVDGKPIVEYNAEGEPFDPIYAMLEDREGNLWIGSKGGLHQLKPRPITTYTKRHGLTHNAVTSVYEDVSGTMWIGTWGGGLNWMKDGVIGGYPFAVSAPEFVLAIHGSPSKSLWFGADYNLGAGHLRDGNLKMFREGDGFIGSAVKVIHEDRSGNLWIGAGNGLSVFRDGKFIRYTTADGLSGNTIQVIHEDQRGVLWFGTTEGLTCRQDGEFLRVAMNHGLSQDSIGAIYEDREGNLWVGTHGGGLCRIQNGQSKTGHEQAGAGSQQARIPGHESPIASRVSRFTSKEGLFDDVLFEILEDDFGYFWMSCPKGIFRVARSDLERMEKRKIERLNCRAFVKDDGMASAVCTGVAKPSGWKSRNGQLWFSTTKGVVTVNPEIKVNSTPPPVLIEEVIADGQDQSLKFNLQSRGAGANASTLNAEHGTWTLQPGRGELEFHYTALSFAAPEKNRFKYKLTGFDRDWVEAGARRVAYYNNLKPGDYTFHVIACNNDGVWNSLGANVKLRLLPRFWQTWWFLGFCGVAAFVAVGGTARYLTKRKMQRELETLERQHALERERARIAQDIHDDLGAGLTRITMLSDLTHVEREHPAEVKAYSEKISSTAREMVRAMDEIVWAVSPKNDTLNSLVEYLDLFADEFFENSKMRCLVERDAEFPNSNISAEVRHNVFLVFKESLNNTLKHSGAAEVRIHMGMVSGGFRIEIRDDGVGFDLAARRGVRHGLDNMSRRMREAGGCFDLWSEPGKGTKIILGILE